MNRIHPLGIVLRKPAHMRVTSRGTARRARLTYIELFAAASLAVAALPGGSAVGAASYFDAHFACTCWAVKLPLRSRLPSTNACDLSINVSGSGSLPT